ncbi:hypothetical protein [Kitasatospora sp. NPDC056184]|uniref:hypothetical protein n=1 Tax=Kitasatospora sp. NPDC056184 TaxID=3345738 RepID=UPI0035E11150
MTAQSDFDRIADELYTLAPGNFTAARNRHADRLKKTDRPLAARIRALRRPTQAAWAANLLAHHHEDLVAELLDLGEELRAAQEQLAGDRLRVLGERRRQLVRELLSRARGAAEDAGHPLGTEAADEVERTLSAALADPDAAEAFAAGRLAAALEPVAWPGTAANGPGISAAEAAPGPAAPGRRRPARVHGTRPSSDAGSAPSHRAADGADGAGKRAEAEQRRRDRERERVLEQARKDAEAAERAGREAADLRDAAERVLADAESARQKARDEAEQAREALAAAERRDERAREDLGPAEERVLAAQKEAGQAQDLAGRASEAALAAAEKLRELESGDRRER